MSDSTTTWKQASVTSINRMSTLHHRTRLQLFTDNLLTLHNTHAEAFTVDYDDGVVIVADRFTKQIKQLQLETGNVKQCLLFSGTSSEVLGLAVDWVANAVYWTDASYDVIMVQNYGGCPPNGQPVVLFDSGIDEPAGIVTHPRQGLLFWVEGGRSPRISRSTLSGKNPTPIVERNTKRPSHLTIDLTTNRLFWIDADNGRLSSCDLNGFHRKTVLRIERAVFAGLAVFKHHAYVTDQRRRAIYVTDLRTGATTKRIALGNKPCNIHTIGLGLQETLSDICWNNSCSGPCVSSEFNRSDCVCRQNAQRISNFWDSVVCQDDPDSPTFRPSLMYTKRFGISVLPENFADSTRSVLAQDLIYSKSYFPSVIKSNVNTGEIFFSDKKANAILKVGLTPDSKVTQILLTLGNVHSLVVDWVSQNLYWTDSVKRAILVSTEDGRYVQYFIHREEHTPKYLAIHPGRRKLFWMNSESIIETCYLDGSFREVIVTDGIMRPTTLELDVRQERLYWSDEGFGHIVSTNLAGKDRKFVFRQVDGVIKAMAIVKDYLVYSDWHYSNRGLHAVNTKTGHYVGHFPEDGLVYGVHFHHISNQPLFQNPCGHNNGGCHHLCLPNFYNYTCACAFGYRLAENNRTCETDLSDDKFILIADQRLGTIYQLDLWRFRFHALPLQTVVQPYSVTFNPEEQKVYWSDVSRGTLNRAHMNGSEQEIILAKDGLSVVKIVVESNSGLLYYLDLSEAVIGVLTTKDLHHRTIIVNLTEARDFAVDSEHGFLNIFASCGSDEGRSERTDACAVEQFGVSAGNRVSLLFVAMETGIVQYNMDGTDPAYHTLRSSLPIGLSLDMSANRMYWFDSRLGQVLTSGTDIGSQTLLVAQTDDKIRALGVDDNYLFWIDSQHTSVFRTRKSNGKDKIVLGEESPFFLPVSIFVQRGRLISHNHCSGGHGCSHICLARKDSFICACPDGMVMKRDGSGCYIEPEARIAITDFCVIPKIEFGTAIQQSAGHVVDEGFMIEISCIDGATISSGRHVTCGNGTWSHTPVCLPAKRNPIYGTETRGQRVFTHSGVFVAPSGVDHVNVVCIGGGGGGRDGRSFRDAGDGGRSSFGDMLVADGGSGGKAANNSGGLGGKGTVASGGQGRLHEHCGGPGGAAGETITDSRDLFPGVSTFRYCGGGGTSDPSCLVDYEETTDIPAGRSGPGGRDPVGAAGGQYGGGSGGAAGGRGGGGGGYSFATIQLHSRRVVNVTVGHPGSPSFARPGQGIVVVAWGGKIDPVLEELHTVDEYSVKLFKIP